MKGGLSKEVHNEGELVWDIYTYIYIYTTFVISKASLTKKASGLSQGWSLEMGTV